MSSFRSQPALHAASDEKRVVPASRVSKTADKTVAPTVHDFSDSDLDEIASMSSTPELGSCPPPSSFNDDFSLEVSSGSISFSSSPSSSTATAVPSRSAAEESKTSVHARGTKRSSQALSQPGKAVRSLEKKACVDSPTARDIDYQSMLPQIEEMYGQTDQNEHKLPVNLDRILLTSFANLQARFKSKDSTKTEVIYSATMEIQYEGFGAKSTFPVPVRFAWKEFHPDLPPPASYIAQSKEQVVCNALECMTNMLCNYDRHCIIPFVHTGFVTLTVAVCPENCPEQTVTRSVVGVQSDFQKLSFALILRECQRNYRAMCKRTLPYSQTEKAVKMLMDDYQRRFVMRALLYRVVEEKHDLHHANKESKECETSACANGLDALMLAVSKDASLSDAKKSTPAATSRAAATSVPAAPLVRRSQSVALQGLREQIPERVRLSFSEAMGVVDYDLPSKAGNALFLYADAFVKEPTSPAYSNKERESCEMDARGRALLRELVHRTNLGFSEANASWLLSHTKDFIEYCPSMSLIQTRHAKSYVQDKKQVCIARKLWANAGGKSKDLRFRVTKIVAVHCKFGGAVEVFGLWRNPEQHTINGKTVQFNHYNYKQAHAIDLEAFRTCPVLYDMLTNFFLIFFPEQQVVAKYFGL